jgi:diguanylate cyclase (GGDEF)-like protein
MNARHRSAWTLAAVSCVALVGWIDATAGQHLSFSVFYLIPVVAAGWLLGRTSAIVTAVAAGMAWMAADAAWRDRDDTLELVWNASTRFTIFIALGWLSGRLRREQRNLLQANAQLRDMVEREAVMARTDSLTGLPNWQGFTEHLQRELARSSRYGEPLALACADLDHFKAINDRYGHEEGNVALRRVSDALRHSVRAMDIAARTGGDEFAVLLPGADAPAARAVTERMVAAVAEVASHYPGCGLGVSVGVVCTAMASEGGDGLMKLADTAMYQSKREGKGRVTVVEGPRAAAPSQVEAG